MEQERTEQWLKDLGYAQHEASLFREPENVPPTHRYAAELRALLAPDGLIQAKAVFDVDGMPTVAFVEANPGVSLDAIRQRIWNQNLVTIVLEVDTGSLHAYSPQPDEARITLPHQAATLDGAWSAKDIQSGDIAQRVPAWFSAQQRVDQHLLNNLGAAVQLLRKQGLSRDAAQYLIGQVLFVSYLEHRDVLSEIYREHHKVGSLAELITTQDRNGLIALFRQLKEDFNGDFLDPKVAKEAGWASLPAPAFHVLGQFLQRVDLRTGQGSLWNYDFRFIPVELLSGIYETFLGEEKDELGAFYTPRHLAQLTVDMAFDGIVDPSQETVFDGACGSGILLTTAFRRMLGHAQASRGEPLNLVERIALLKARIFGSDISEPACRVSAFSLYLSLLEELVPRDLVELTSDPNVKLPELLGSNLIASKHGDFFAKTNPFAGKAKFTVLLSNPPWSEPDLRSTGDAVLGYEVWAKRAGRLLVRRQIAAAYAQRAVDCVTATGRLVLILPASLLLAPTSQLFLVDWLSRVRPERVINFGDMRRQLFAAADHGCVVIVARPRDPEARPVVPVSEVFDYWIPKVDVSLAFGRLTLHTSDRAQVQTQELIQDNAVLRYRTWGTEADMRFVRRLQREGTIKDLAEERGWAIGKGFNRTRHNSPKLSPARLRKLPYLHARAIPRQWPVLPDDALKTFPKEIDTVVSYGSQDGVAFRGPRVLYPDGISADLEIRSVFVNDDCCFQHTVAAIVGTQEDEDLLRFMSIYLRSPLVRYLIMQTAFSPLSERERITVTEVNALPLAPPNTSERRKIVRRVATISRSLERQAQQLLKIDEPDLSEAYELVEAYMGLSDVEAGLVHDITAWALPSRQSDAEGAKITPWQSAPDQRDLLAYARTLQRELARLRDARGGKGQFEVAVHAGRRFSRRGVGVVEIQIHPKGGTRAARVENQSLDAIEALVSTLARERVIPMAVTENLFLSSDICVLHGNRAYLVKPLARRLWRVGLANEDAVRLANKAAETAA